MNTTYKVEMVRCKVVKDRTISLPRHAIKSMEDAQVILHRLTDDSPSEKFVVMHINSQNSIVGVEVVSQGGRSSSCFTPAEVLRSAIIRNASAIIVGHNHPSGDPEPSEHDLETTRALEVACGIIGIALLDHIIVARNGKCCSLLERGIIRR